MTTKDSLQVEQALAHAAREEELYHESARYLANRVAELESTVEGLGQENTQLVRALEEEKALNLELSANVSQHKNRYAGAIKVIERRQGQLNLERRAYQALAVQYTQLAEKHSKLSVEIAVLNNSVRDLHNVNTVHLDDAINALANAIDTALLR